MDPDKLEQAITPRTKVIIPVHIYGHPADMPRILEIADHHRLPVLEDAAQAHGATWQGRRVGALGHAASFSFYPGKNLGAYGDAGIVVSNDETYLAKVRQIANHGGGANKYDNVLPGTNSRLDTLQAAVLRVKLPHLDKWNDERRACAELYTKLLADVPGVGLPHEKPGARSAWHLYTIRVEDRAALQADLQKQGISTAIHYPRPLHLQPAMAVAGGKLGDLPVTERLANEVVSLPLYPELEHAEIERIAAAVARFHEARVAS
jgi:dTDP-4-amino-4,6-dideoxygalactose transaminase